MRRPEKTSRRHKSPAAAEDKAGARSARSQGYSASRREAQHKKPRNETASAPAANEAPPGGIRVRLPRSSPAETGFAVPASEPMRIAKAIAKAGVCSRRDAEKLIEARRVKVNGKTLDTPAHIVSPSDIIEVDGKALTGAEPVRLWRYYKPRGRVTTHRDPEGRPTVFDAMPADMPRVVSIGRLDFNTEGLLLLTTDGALARHLELPATGWLRRYRVRAWGDVTQEKLDALQNGVEVDGIRYGAIEARLDRMQGHNVWLTIGFREGKNREVRRVLATVGLDVNRLIRISYGPFQLNELQPGDIELVRRGVLADQLGPSLAHQFGLIDDNERIERDVREERNKRRRAGKPEPKGKPAPKGSPRAAKAT